MIIQLMRLSILIIAGFSAISAVAGLGAVFKGAFWPVVIAGCGIELGRYSLVAYTVQQRDTLSRAWTISVVCVVLGISLFTNMGIFGFLGDSMQSTHSKVKKTDTDVSSIAAEKARLESRIVEIDRQVALLPAEFVTGRLKLIAAFSDERKEISANLKEINAKLATSQVDSVQNLDALGPIVYTAQAFGISVDTAIAGMMWAFTLSLDMFALFLTVFTNLHVAKQPKPVVEDKKPVVKSPDVSASEWHFK